MIQVKRLHPDAKLPQCAHPGEDLGYDIFSVETKWLEPGKLTKIRTGIALASFNGYGFILQDRSSMANRGIFTHAGVIDAGYRGEICALFTCLELCRIHSGDKIAQLIPVEVLTMNVLEVQDFSQLPVSERGEDGFGSTGA